MPSAQANAREVPVVTKELPSRPRSVSFEEANRPRSSTSGSDLSSGRVDRSPDRSIEKPGLKASRNSSRNGYQTDPRSSLESTPADARVRTEELPPLQVDGVADETLEPIKEDDPSSYELVAPVREGLPEFSLESRSQLLFSREHLASIFADPALLFKFTAFVSNQRPSSVPLLIYYLDALKAIRAIKYSNAVAEALEPLVGHPFSQESAKATLNSDLEHKASASFDAMAQEDLPAYIAYQYTQIVSLTIAKRITGTLPPHLREASEGLAEVFCLTDPSRPDNPIVFASEEFHRTTQYGMGYVLGRNCRFLQGPWTNPSSVRRLREATEAGRECCEVFLNYRRDGSPFMNLLMIAPLRDSRGSIRYFIGAQVDVSGLVKDCTEMESLARLLAERSQREEEGEGDDDDEKTLREKKDELEELSEMLNTGELATIRRTGGRMHREPQDDEDSVSNVGLHRPRLLLKEPSGDVSATTAQSGSASGKLSGVYQHYLLVRPYPSLRILFASPSQRVPGILQSPFLDRISGSDRVRQELTAALAEGRGVTAKVRWTSKFDEEGRIKWIHCTPLIGSNGNIGVWMVVIVNDDKDQGRRWRQAPPVSNMIQPLSERGRSKAEANGVNKERTMNGVNGTKMHHGRQENGDGPSPRPESPSSLRL